MHFVSTDGASLPAFRLFSATEFGASIALPVGAVAAAAGEVQARHRSGVRNSPRFWLNVGTSSDNVEESYEALRVGQVAPSELTHLFCPRLLEKHWTTNHNNDKE